ncbi:MAG: biopolymer transporter ExbD [Gammaproteobacteria bacterium]|nr:biopolymer transporter ExbD [Gammaproteobacteria bacterium]
MPRGHHYRKHKDPPDLDITSFLNLMVVLVPFLLITAVFSRIVILHLNLPTGVGSLEATEKKITIEVIVRKELIEIGDGKQVVMRIANLEDGNYDITGLGETLAEIKRNYPSKQDSVVLMEADLEYQVLVTIMDAVSTFEMTMEDGSVERFELFPQISIGDAPGEPGNAFLVDFKTVEGQA